jgi:hypothetical protein
MSLVGYVSRAGLKTNALGLSTTTALTALSRIEIYLERKNIVGSTGSAGRPCAFGSIVEMHCNLGLRVRRINS